MKVSVAGQPGYNPKRTGPLLANGVSSSWFMFITMKENMKQRYSVFLRPWGVFYYEDHQTGKQATLKTRDKDEAFRLVAAKNENEDAPAFSLHLARVYWKAGDPTGATRTWQHVMDEIPKLKIGETGKDRRLSRTVRAGSPWTQQQGRSPRLCPQGQGGIAVVGRI